MKTPVSEIQSALQDANLDGWLFYDHHFRDPLGYSILRFEAPRTPSRRWYYFIPRSGEPQRLVHRVEPAMLDALPGGKSVYSGWNTLREGLPKILGGARRIAMQHSPNCEIPYVAMVDAGTIDLIRSFGVEVASSADLVQHFEARWSGEQLESHLEAGRRVDAIRRAAFARIAEAVAASRRVTEHEIAQFIRDQFAASALFTDHGPIVAVNANASNPHYEPSASNETLIRPGDLVLIDMWAKLAQPDSVYYDITWTGFCGTNPPANMANVFGIVQRARTAGSDFVKAEIGAHRSICGYQVDDAVRGVIQGAGFGDYFVHRTGHSIGQEVHGNGANMDNLESHDTRRLIPRTCFSIEPGIYLPEFGVRSEVNCYIGENSAMVTGEEQDKLLLLQ